MNEQENDRRAVEERVSREGRLPPNQAVTVKFPVLHYGPIPAFNPASWEFRIWGEVVEPKQWSWEEFNQLPRGKSKNGYSLCDRLEQV